MYLKSKKMSIESNPVLNSPILSQLETIDFVEDIHRNCMEVDSEGLKKTLNKYNLLKHPETHDFLLQADSMFEQFNKNPNIKILSVVKFDTKCIACAFGKVVNGYNVEYSKNEKGLNLIYNWSFGINLNIQKEMLFDFAHCNAFLSKSEYQKI